MSKEELIDIIRGLVESSRPGTTSENVRHAWERAGRVLREYKT